MKIVRDISQGDDLWFELRKASIGGSGISKVDAKGKGKVRSAYLNKLVYQIITKRIVPTYQNDDMRLGSASEPEARNTYIWQTDCEIEEVAMVQNGEFKHFSPDGLSLCGNGMIEIKNINEVGYIETLSKKRMPPGHNRQIQWGLNICEREWCDFVQSHYIWKNREAGEVEPGYADKPIWVKRIYRNEELIKELDESADKFITELLMTVAKVKNGS